ncbi:MAG: DUF502 domain-containing protein [Gammaproteobacteria bacterium]
MHENLRKVINYFLIGVLALVPVVVTLEIVLFVKGIVANVFRSVYGYSDSYLYTALVFASSFAIFAYIGYRVSLGKSWIIHSIDHVIKKVPVLNTVYRVTKKIVNLITGHEQKMAREVVYIEYPKEGLWVPAYVTNREKSKYILFVPTSPNPTSGFTIIVDESKVVKSKMSIEEATSFIVSVGVDFDQSEEVTKLR